jgi:hypothetical protein
MTGIVPVHPLPKLPATKVLTGGTTTILNTVAGPTLSHDIAAWATFGQVSTLGSNIPTSEISYDLSSGAWLGPVSSPFTALSGVDWTMEMWVYMNTVGATVMFDFRNMVAGASTAPYSMTAVINAGGVPYMNLSDSTTYTPVTSGAVSPNTWTHVVWMRSGSSFYNYVRGVKSSAIALSAKFDTLAQMNLLTMGTDNVAFPIQSMNAHLYGAISQAKIRVGAKYSASFAPASDLTPLTGDTSTVFFLGRKRENTVTGQTITIGRYNAALTVATGVRPLVA